MEKKSIGSFLTALRKASGLTQKQLAEKLNVSDKAVSRWERDECAPDLSLIPVLAEIYGVKEGLFLAFVKRLPSLRLADTHCLELCAGPNCPKKAPLADFVEKTYGAKPKGFTLKYVPCMRFCAKGPNIRWDGKVYHGADEALIRKLVSEIEK